MLSFSTEAAGIYLRKESPITMFAILENIS